MCIGDSTRKTGLARRKEDKEAKGNERRDPKDSFSHSESWSRGRKPDIWAWDSCVTIDSSVPLKYKL